MSEKKTVWRPEKKEVPAMEVVDAQRAGEVNEIAARLRAGYQADRKMLMDSL
jgi:hypothetical protein